MDEAPDAGQSLHDKVRIVLFVVPAIVAVAIFAILMVRPLEASAISPAGDGEHALIPEFGERGALFLRYEHDMEAAYGFRLRNDGLLAITVTGIEDTGREEHQMFQPSQIRLASSDPGDASPPDLEETEPFAAFRLEPGASRLVVVVGRFSACRYYTERAVEIHDRRSVTYRILGTTRTQEVTFPEQVIVRSPTIQNCPDRQMDRASHQRRGADDG